MLYCLRPPGDLTCARVDGLGADEVAVYVDLDLLAWRPTDFAVSWRDALAVALRRGVLTSRGLLVDPCLLDVDVTALPVERRLADYWVAGGGALPA